MKKYNVLIFPANTEIANEVRDSLKNNKYFSLFGASSLKKSHANYVYSKVHFLPFCKDNAFLEKINLLIISKKIDIVIPCHDDACLVMSKFEDDIKAIIIGQSYKINKIIRDKSKTYNYFKSLIPTPKISNYFPVFIKPKKGSGSKNSLKIDNQIQLESFLNDKEKDDFIIMEYLNGDEFTIDCLSINGKLEFHAPRVRYKTINGISAITDEIENEDFTKYAKIISKELKMDGAWFFQMMYDKNNKLKLLEIAPRIAGSSCLSRIKGVNFIELSIYNKLNIPISLLYNDINISISKHLAPIFKTKIKFNNIYIDFDDTLILFDKYINHELLSIIFECKNHNKKIFLLTKHNSNFLYKLLDKFGITKIFDQIIQIDKNENKIDYIESESVLIDDSYYERSSVIKKSIYAFSNDNFKILKNNII